MTVPYRLRKSLKRIWVFRALVSSLRGFMGVLQSTLPLRVAACQYFLKHSKSAKFSTKLNWDAVERPAYGYGMFNAALLARELGYEEISAIEFGVAGGNGLVAMEQIALEVERELGVKFSIWGFDSAVGLPKSNDVRDQVYFWQSGDFKMDLPLLRSRLKKSQLIIGPIADSVRSFIEVSTPSPIGFIAFDLDYYSSTRDALALLENDHDSFLPRVECYMDDVSSWGMLSASMQTGVLAAIEEFNSTDTSVKVLKKEDVGRLRKISGSWFNTVYVAHFFSHPHYNNSVHKFSGVTNELELIE